MARLNDDAQWIVLMAFIISFSLFFLAVVLNQSTVVGQTTAEAVSEFPKEDIRGSRALIIQSMFLGDGAPHLNRTNVQNEIQLLARNRQNAVVDFSSAPDPTGDYLFIKIHYNNGVSTYNENWTFPSERF
jgi:hypothetical protein